MRNRLSKISYLILMYVFLYLPIAVLIIFSFNKNVHSLLWHGFTLNWYHQLFQDSDLATVTWHSFTLALSAATSATALGAFISVTLFRYRFFGRSLLNGLLLVLIIVPDIVIAISMLLLFRFLNLHLGFTSLLIAHIAFCMPFVYITVSSRAYHLDPAMIEAAKDLGATESTIFFKIIIPLLWPALVTSWLLSFALSFDDVIISFFNSGPDFSVLPLKIFSMVRIGVSPEVNALCTILLGFTLLIVLSSQLLLRKKA
jgi:spermidine/putrescine transport system permease protein